MTQRRAVRARARVGPRLGPKLGPQQVNAQILLQVLGPSLDQRLSERGIAAGKPAASLGSLERFGRPFTLSSTWRGYRENLSETSKCGNPSFPHV
jgi:hypothetical protein